MLSCEKRAQKETRGRDASAHRADHAAAPQRDLPQATGGSFSTLSQCDAETCAEYQERRLERMRVLAGVFVTVREGDPEKGRWILSGS